MNRRDFRRLAEMRLADAQVLLANRRYAAAYYLAGYAVECGLKACIARQYGRYEFPPKNVPGTLYIHDLGKLATNEKLAGALDTQKRSVPRFASNWVIVTTWNEDSRYRNWTKEEAHELIDARTEVPDGVMEWIRQLW
ncbi:MAG: HEPN domain-containing protein [Chloroflexota bacterium]